MNTTDTSAGDLVERKARNLQAALTARANSMLKLRDALVLVTDHIEDEGDRKYFGSTNDADLLVQVQRDLDDWVWDDIMADGELPDVYESSRKAHEELGKAQAELTALRSQLAERGSAKPDYCYDPKEWDCTHAWHDRSELTMELPLGGVMEVVTLIEGPSKWAVHVPISWDEDGDPDDTEVKWFNSEEAANAALLPTPVSSTTSEG